MRPVLQRIDPRVHPLQPPTVDPEFRTMGGLQRATESLRYSLLSIEWWISPDGRIREWLRRNSFLGVWLLIPAVLVMPIIGLILWQFTGWLSMLTAIFGKLIILPVLFVLALLSISIALRIVTAFLKR